MGTWLKEIWGYLRETHFKDYRWVSSLVVLIGYLGIYFSLTKIVREISTAWPGHQEFQLYLLVSYFGSGIGWAIMVLLTRQMWHSKNEARNEKQIMSEIGHELAEAIRANAAELSAKRPITTKLSHDHGRLVKIMSRLNNLLTMQLERDDITITMKLVHGEPSTRQLRTVLRDSRDAGTSERPAEMPAEASLIYKQFVDGDRRYKWVIIRDVTTLDSNGPSVPAAYAKCIEDYQAHAKQCGFRSLVGFPLRQPAGNLGKLNAHGIVGFLSFDSPREKAFDKLFKEGPLDKASRDSNDGRHFKTCKDGQFFFLVTDSLATLAIMEAGA